MAQISTAAPYGDVAGDDSQALRARVAALDWPAVERDLNARGYAVAPALLDADACRALAALYDEPQHFRSRVVMARHGFGRGEYRYFEYPLPATVTRLRMDLYPRLAAIANRWNERLAVPERFPERHTEFIARCHAAGQARPTPLLLSYGPDDYNCLHQDLYGAHVFPLQVTVLLSVAGEEFSGGELVLTEQRPRRQSRAEVVPLTCGDAAIFAVAQRPVDGARGVYRVNMRHGVSRVRAGARRTLGIIFHDAQ